jgi:hypothetical protein
METSLVEDVDYRKHKPTHFIISGWKTFTILRNSRLVGRNRLEPRSHTSMPLSQVFVMNWMAESPYVILPELHTFNVFASVNLSELSWVPLPSHKHHFPGCLKGIVLWLSIARLLSKLIGLVQLANSPSCTVALVLLAHKNTFQGVSSFSDLNVTEVFAYNRVITVITESFMTIMHKGIVHTDMHELIHKSIIPRVFAMSWMPISLHNLAGSWAPCEAFCYIAWYCSASLPVRLLLLNLLPLLGFYSMLGDKDSLMTLLALSVGGAVIDLVLQSQGLGLVVYVASPGSLLCHSSSAVKVY